ncbi:MAG: hypothetical protein FJ279_28930 [Planctomycetes bacterium]|nr:hypothetical protein [Planctomycetota bacterium]
MADVLNEIIKLHRAYVWSYDSATGMANLFPRDRNILSWRVTDVDFKDKTLREIFISDDLLSLRQHGIAFFRGRGNLGWLDDTKVSLKAQNTQARLLLNQLCSQLPFAALWHVELHEPGWQGATATLMFKGFAVKPRSPEQSQDDAK